MYHWLYILLIQFPSVFIQCFCYISPSKPVARALGSICHTMMHNRFDLYSSWCSKCAVIAVTHEFECVESIMPDLFICSPCDNDACLSTTPPP